MSSRWISISASAPGRFAVDRGVHRLDQRALAHAARAPQQHVVGRQPAREPPGVLQQDVAHPVDAAQAAPIATRLTSRPAPAGPVGVPDEGVGGRRDRRRRGGGREPLERLGDPVEQRA